jgi:hypothetical protein
LNSRPPAPKAGALTKLRHSPEAVIVPPGARASVRVRWGGRARAAGPNLRSRPGVRVPQVRRLVEAGDLGDRHLQDLAGLDAVAFVAHLDVDRGALVEVDADLGDLGGEVHVDEMLAVPEVEAE